MPTPALASLAKRAGVSKERAEHLWKKAKSVAKEQRSEDHPKFWALVTGILKKMLGLSSGKKKEDLDYDLLLLGWSPELLLCEQVLDRNSASFMKSRSRKLASEIKGIEDGTVDWNQVALNLKLFLDSFIDGLSQKRGIVRRILGEMTVTSKISHPDAMFKVISQAKTREELLRELTKLFPMADVSKLREVVYGSSPTY